jgi:hypothetical protein
VTRLPMHSRTIRRRPLLWRVASAQLIVLLIRGCWPGAIYWHAAVPVKLRCPSRMASTSGNVNGNGFSPGLLNVSDITSFAL